MENTKIEWATHTFNPWIGCAKVSPGCANCYAERDFDHRYGRAKWGVNGTRTRTGTANWRKPLTWNRQAEATGHRPRVFCASLADVFEDREELQPWRADLLLLIQKTPHLDWLLLTKRPQNVMRMVNDAWQSIGGSPVAAMPPNVWIGTSVENQAAADERIPHLLEIPAAVRFLSCEPLLGSVDLSKWVDEGLDMSPEERVGWELPSMMGIKWVIVGGESGPKSRPMHPDWPRPLRDQCQAAGVSFFFKQWGQWLPFGQQSPDDDGTWCPPGAIVNINGQNFQGVGKKLAGRLLDGREWNETP